MKLPNFTRVQPNNKSPKLTLCCCLSFRPSEEGGVLKLTPGQQDNSARKLWISTLVWNKSDFCWLRLMMELCKNKNMLILGITFFFSIFDMFLFWREKKWSDRNWALKWNQKPYVCCFFKAYLALETLGHTKLQILKKWFQFFTSYFWKNRWVH